MAMNKGNPIVDISGQLIDCSAQLVDSSAEGVDFDVSYFFAEQSERLDEVAVFLKACGHEDLAKYLLKLQQDMGLELDWAFNGKSDFPSGPEDASLRSKYELVTMSRLLPLREIAVIMRAENFSGEFLGELTNSIVTKLPSEPNVPKAIGFEPTREI